MDGCVVEDIARLEDSLLGRRVRVRPGDARAGAITLMVGDDCVVELARHS
jgi:glucose-1-phosphate thymidylyltransferase